MVYLTLIQFQLQLKAARGPAPLVSIWMSIVYTGVLSCISLHLDAKVVLGLQSGHMAKQQASNSTAVIGRRLALA